MCGDRVENIEEHMRESCLDGCSWHETAYTNPAISVHL